MLCAISSFSVGGFGNCWGNGGVVVDRLHVIWGLGYWCLCIKPTGGQSQGLSMARPCDLPNTGNGTIYCSCNRLCSREDLPLGVLCP